MGSLKNLCELSALAALSGILIACSGGGNAVSGISSPSTAPRAEPKQVAGQQIYVGNNNFSLTTYAIGTDGNAAPTATLKGQNTQLKLPVGLALDSAKRIYVANGSVDEVMTYPAGASGDIAPAAIISGGNTGLDLPWGVALDSVGNIYVLNQGTAGPSSVTIYTAGSNGNATPTATISGANTGLGRPMGLALDASGKIYVTNWNDNGITIYPPGTNGNVAPTATIAGANTGLDGPVGVALDAAGKMYVTNYHINSITIYSPGTNGNVAPAATIAGANTGLDGPLGVALDAAGNIYVTNEGDVGPASVTIYAAGSNGNAAPIATISGANTGLISPSGIAVD